MTDKQLKDKAINFKGSDYVQVKDRVLYLADNYDGRYEIDQDYQYYEQTKTWVVKTTLTIRDEKHEKSCKYVWLAQEVEWTSFINKTSCLENCATSSLWRSVACLGIWVIDSFASINEIEKAENRAKSQTKTFSKESVFQRAYNNTDFMKNCLDEDNFILEVKKHMELDEIQEWQLRSRYQEMTKPESPDNLPFN